jgi:hypothetical protein
VFEPHHCLGRETSALDSEKLCGLYNGVRTHRSLNQGCACLSPGSAIRRHKFARHTGRTSSSIRPDLDFRYIQVVRSHKVALWPTASTERTYTHR